MDAAVVRRVVVGVSGSLANLAALHAGESLARRCGAELLLVHAQSGHDPRRGSGVLRAACDDAFGGPPDGIPFATIVMDGAPTAVLSSVATRPGDVLVMGTGRGMLRRTSRINRHCARNSRCPVVSVPPPPMMRAERRVLARIAD